MNQKKVDSIIKKEIEEKSGTLDFVDCGLKMIPEEIFEMTWLTHLRISHNPPPHDRANRVESMDAYSKYERSKKLNNLKISQLPEGLAKLTHLEVLEIYPQLTGNKGRWPLKDVTVLKDLKKLKHLNLSSNAITSVRDLKNLQELEYLALKSNQIVDIWDFKDLKNLKYLDLSFNSTIKKKGFEILNRLSWLTELHISYTSPGSLDCIARCRNLEVLSIDYTDIKDFSVTKMLPHLTVLDGSHIKGADFPTLKNVKNLKELNLSYNKIEDISFLKRMKDLETLNLRYNSLVDIRAIRGMKKMKKLLIGNNRIVDISALGNMKEMDELSLFNNKIEDISVLNHMKKISNLFIKDNPIADYNPLLSLKDLMYLNDRKAKEEISDEDSPVMIGRSDKEIKKAIEYISSNNNEKLRSILEEGLDPRSTTVDNTPLWMVATEHKNYEAYAIINEFRAIYNISKEIKEAYYYIKEGNIESLKTLFKQGLDPNSCDGLGATLLNLAVENNQTEITKLLIELKALKYKKYSHPILSVAQENLDIFKLLINSDLFNIEVAERAFRSAAYNNRIDTASVLLKKKLDISNCGKIALKTAAEQGHKEFLEFLFQQGYEMNTLYDDMNILMFIADSCFKNKDENTKEKLDLISYLLSEGADPSIENSRGWKACDFAKERKNKEVVELLKPYENTDLSNLIDRLRKYNLPEESITYLSDTKTEKVFNWPQKSNIKRAELNGIEDMILSSVPIYTWEYRTNEHSQNSAKDPNIEKDGYYSVTAINYLHSVNSYNESGLLIWIPELQQFGTADTEHGVLYIFKDIPWDAIMKDLHSYINYQWYPTSNKKIVDIYEFCNPWELWKLQ